MISNGVFTSRPFGSWSLSACGLPSPSSSATGVTFIVSPSIVTRRKWPPIAQAAVKAAETRRDLLTNAISGTLGPVPLEAPFDGVLRKVLAAPGEAVTAGTPLYELADLSRLWIRVPVYVGDLVSFYTDVVRIGRTSITVSVEVFAQRGEGTGQIVRVTQAEVTFVNLDENRKPIPIPR